MLPKARELRDRWFEWPESRFERFDFHRPEHLDLLADTVASSAPPAVVLATGERGIGRGYLCEAVAHRWRADGTPIGVWHLDLDGFEPDDPHPLDAYLRHLTDEEARRVESARSQSADAARSTGKALSGLDLLGGASELAAALVSLAWRFEDPLRHVVDAVARPSFGSSPPRDDPQSLRRFLDAVTADQRLIIHLHDAVAVPVSLRRLLIHEAERRPDRLLLVLGLPDDETADDLAADARHEPLRLAVTPLDAEALRRVLDARFAPYAFPDDFLDGLVRLTGGWPSALANTMADLMEAEAVSSVDGTWRLPAAGIDDERVVAALSAGLYAEIRERLDEEEPEQRKILGDFVLSAAICGRFVPIALPLGYFGLDEDARESVIDWVDDVLVDELGWLEDLEFRHPSFPGLNIYAFRHPLLRQVILHEASEYDRVGQAVSLLRFLEQRGTPIVSRGMARLFLSIAEHLDPEDRGPYAARLSWWTGLDEAEALKDKARRDLASRRVDAELLWRIARTSQSWPSIRRVALLEILDEIPGSVPADQAGQMQFLWATLLHRTGDYSEALRRARLALDHADEESVAAADALSVIGRVQIDLGEAEAALAELERARQISQDLLGPDDLRSLMSNGPIAQALIALDRFQEAKTLTDEVLPPLEDRLPAGHPFLLLIQGALGQSLAGLGEHEAARRRREDVFAASTATFGKVHPETLSAMFNLAQTLIQVGQTDRGLAMLETSMDLHRTTLGNDHPETLTNAIGWHNVLTDLAPESQRLVDLRRWMKAVAEHSERARDAFAQVGIEL